jgi:lactate dehydrogenase-like 2-hydroxyacid dehydrogenase
MSKPKILVTRRWPEPCEARLRQLFDVTFNEDNVPLSPAQIRAAMSNHDALLPTVSDKLPAETFTADPLRCRILGNFGAGFNHIDLEAARQRGIVVTNTPGVLTESTADIAVMLMLMAARRASEAERLLRAGEWTGWHPTQLLGTQVAGKTLGMIGFGRIAQAMAAKAHFGFNMPIIFYKPRPADPELLERFQARQMDSIESVLQEADFVALHCPGSTDNYHLINAERLALMKPGAILINTARGDVVDNKALITALREKKIAAAGLDVYEGEPNLDPGFLSLDNAVLLPHLGSATTETRIAMGMKVIENLESFFRGEKPPNRIV